MTVEPIADFRVFRCVETGKYTAHVQVSERIGYVTDVDTVDECVSAIADIIRADLRRRKTIELEPVRG